MLPDTPGSPEGNTEGPGTASSEPLLAVQETQVQALSRKEPVEKDTTERLALSSLELHPQATPDLLLVTIN